MCKKRCFCLYGDADPVEEGKAFASRSDRFCKIIEKVNYDFAGIAENISELNEVAWIMRSIYIDEVIKNFLDQHPKATIVNIGCGMDTTFDSN